MRFLCLSIFIITLLTFVIPSFAQEATPEEYIVRLVYFYPKGTQPHANIDVKLDEIIKQTQKYFADQMENHGYGRKTFKFETDANGNAVVHQVLGKKEASHYRGNVLRCVGEFEGRIQTRNTILAIFIDNVGYNAGVAYGTKAIVPGVPFWGTIGHELGHTFGLPHDWRGGKFLMSYSGVKLISECAAQWLDVHRFFNRDRTATGKRPNIKDLPVVAYPPGLYHVYFEVTDSDGLHHAQLQTLPTWTAGLSMHGCETLQGEKDYFEYISSGRGAQLTVQDVHGNKASKWISLKDVEPYMVLDISAGASGINDGLIGYWTFDEASGGHAFDGSGNSRYAHLSGGAVLDFNGGKIGGALRLDGSTQSANVDSSSDLINGLSAFSLCLWVKSNGTNTDRGFINGRTPNDKDDIFGFRYDKDSWGGGQRNVIRAGITTTDGTHALESSGNVQTKEWQHLVFTWRSGQKMRLYVNGALDTLSFIQPAISGTITDVDKLVIGRGGKDRSRGWNGSIDDVRLYNRVLSAREITDLPYVNNRTAGFHDVVLTGIANLTPDMVDAGTGIKYIFTVTNAGNRSDTIRLATSGNVTTTLSETSVSLAPGASSTVRLTIPGETLLVAGDHRVEVTATSEGNRRKTAQTVAKVTVKITHGVSLGMMDSIATERLYVGQVGQGTDHTFTVTNNGTTNDTIQLTTSAGAAVTLSETSVSLAPGASSKVTLTVPGAALTVPGGYIVQVTATSKGDKEKTAQIITTTYVYPSSIEAVDIQNGLIGYWTFDEGTGDTAADSSVNGHDLTRTDDGGTGWAPTADARIGNSAFHAGGERVYFEAGTSDFINGLSQFSLALWVKSEWPGTDRGFVLGKWDNRDDFLFSFRYDNEGFLGKADNCILAGITTTEGKHIIETSEDSTSTDWQYLVFTWTSGGTISVYIDGVLDTLSHTGAAVAGTITEVTNFTIGRGSRTTGSKGWRGYIDDVRLYNRVLTHTEIVALAAENITASFPTPTHSYQVKLAGIGDLTNQTQDASAGATYYFTVTNSGDTKDTIRLTTTGDATGTLSRTSVSLSPGTSSDETLTIPGTALKVPGEYVVKVTATSQGDSTKIAQLETMTTIHPKTRALPNFPNPCNPETWIPYQLATSSDVTVKIYAVTGDMVRTLALGHQPAGLYQSKSRAAYWDGTNKLGESVASGIYFYRFEAGDYSATRKMLILK